MAADFDVRQRVCSVDTTLVSVTAGQRTDTPQRRAQEKSNGGWRSDVKRSDGRSTQHMGTERARVWAGWYEQPLFSPLGCVFAVLPSDSGSSLFPHSPPPTHTPSRISSPSSLYLLCRIYLTHSSRRGNKLALSINLTDNYSQETIQRKE